MEGVGFLHHNPNISLLSFKSEACGEGWVIEKTLMVLLIESEDIRCFMQHIQPGINSPLVRGAASCSALL
jgi:hypothetical protein